MDIDEIRSAVRATLATIAPECDARQIVPERPLREQIDLDSLDWLNLVETLRDRLRVDIPESDQDRLATFDSMVSYLASRLAQPAAPASRDTARAAVRPPRTLHDLGGTTVTVRPMRPEDADLDAEFVRHLSSESRRNRFMVALRELPPAKLAQLTNVDGASHVALIATVPREGREAAVGVAHYFVDASGAGCEFAIAVDDDWQGSGVAGVLMNALIDTARERGLARMEGIVLASNLGMLTFARQLGFSVRPDPEDRKMVRVVRSLRGSPT